VQKLLAVAPRWFQCIILLAAHAGFRRGDCLRAAPIHYDPQTRILKIKQQKTGNPLEIPATDALHALLSSPPTGDPATPFYRLFRDKPISEAGLDRAWQRLKKKAGVKPNLWLHDLRRTLAVSIYEVSRDLRVVEQMLGHTSLASTIRYLEHRDPQKLAPYLKQLHTPRKPEETVQ
jgi:integrase